jgi:hypothetical protein
MIHPSYLATLRCRMRAEILVTMIQLEQLTPGWWETSDLLAAELGLCKRTMHENLRVLSRAGLVAHFMQRRSSHTWLWWVKRSPDDSPDPAQIPVYVLRSLTSHRHDRIPVNAVHQWAETRGLCYETVRKFLAGDQRILRNRWQLISTPLDLEPEEVAA